MPDPLTAADETALPALLYTTRRFPIYYLAITKTGCTFLKNLFYQLDHDRPHPAGIDIHDHEADLLRAEGRSADHIRSSTAAFTIVRAPWSRFRSLYYEKAWGTGPRSFPFLRAAIQDAGGPGFDAPLSVEAHRANAHALLSVIRTSLDGRGRPVNPHWRPQAVRLRRVRSLGIRHLAFDHLEDELVRLLERIVPDIGARIAATATRHEGPRPEGGDVLADDTDLRAAVEATYAADRTFHTRALSRSERRLSRVIRLAVSRRLAVRAALVPGAAPEDGATQLDALLYRLDHGVPHPDPARIAAEGARAELLLAPRLAVRGARIAVFPFPHPSTRLRPGRRVTPLAGEAERLLTAGLLPITPDGMISQLTRLARDLAPAVADIPAGPQPTGAPVPHHLAEDAALHARITAAWAEGVPDPRAL